MAFGQAQDDDQDSPAVHPFLATAAGMMPAVAQGGAPSGPVVAPGAPSPVPMYIAAPAAGTPGTLGAATSSAAPQEQSQAPIQATTTPQPARPAVVLPTAPIAPTVDMDRYHALESQLKTDQTPTKVAPKWWERVAGGAVGAATAWREGASAGARAGAQITNRGQDAADAEQAQRVSNDKSALDQFDKERRIDTDQYETQLKGFGAGMETARATQSQDNTDRNFDYQKGRDTRNDARQETNDTFDHNDRDRTYERQIGRDTAEDKRYAAQMGETGRHNRAEEGLAGARLALERENSRKGSDPKGPNTTVTPEQWQGLIKERNGAYKKAQDAMTDELSVAKTDADKTAIRQKYEGQAAQMQNEWNSRLSTADPTGRYADKNKPAGQSQSTPVSQQQPAAPPQAQPVAPAAPPQQPTAPQPQQPGRQQKPTKLTDTALVQQYLKQAGGDKAKARALAQADNYTF